MNQVIKINLLRLKKNKLFLVGCVSIFIISCALVYVFAFMGDEFDNFDVIDSLSYFPIIIIAMLSVLCPVFIGADTEYGTIRNIIVCGKSRIKVLGAQVITTTIMGFTYSIIWLVVLGVGIGAFGKDISGIIFLKGSVIGLFQILVFAIMYTFITLIAKTQLIGTILCLMVTGALMVIYFIAFEIHVTNIYDVVRNDSSYERYEIEKQLSNIDIKMLSRELELNILSSDEKKEVENTLKEGKDEYERQYGSAEKFKQNDDMIDMGLVKDRGFVYNFIKCMFKGNPIHYCMFLGINTSEWVVEKSDKSKDYDNIDYNNDLDDTYIDKDNKLTIKEKKAEKRRIEIEKELLKDEQYKKLNDQSRQLRNNEEKLMLDMEEKTFSEKYCSFGEMILLDVIWSIGLFTICYYFFKKKNIN